MKFQDVAESKGIGAYMEVAKAKRVALADLLGIRVQGALT